MTAIKPTASSTDTPRKSRAHPPLHSSPAPINQQQHLPSSASPSPPISSFSPPPSPSTTPLTLTLTHPRDTTATFTNNNATTATTTTSHSPNNTRTRSNDNHTHRLSHQAIKQDHRTKSSKNNNNHIHTHHHGHHRQNQHLHNSPTNSSNSNIYSRRIHVRRHSASAYYTGPVDHDRVIHTANAHAAASGILSPRLRNSRLLPSPKGPQPQRHLLRQQRQQQQQLRRHQQQQLLQSFTFDLPHQFHRQQQQQEQVQVQEQQPEEQQHHTNRRGSWCSIQLPSISPSSSVSVVSPLALHRASSMPLVHTRPFEKQDQEEAVPSALQQSQPLPPQPPFYRLLQRPPQLRQQQQHRKQAPALESDDQDRPIDEPPPDPRLISQRLLQWQEQQHHRERQEEQRQMQAFRIKKFSDSNTDLDYRPVATTITALKEGFQEHWGGPIVEHQQEGLEDGQQHSRRSSIQQDDRDVDLAGLNDEHGNNNLWEERRRRQRQVAQEHEMMETDSVMETDRTGDGDGDEEMSPRTKLQRARKAKEDAMKEYQEAGRNLQRAQEREEAILFENEMIEVEVGSSVSQQLHRCQGGHTHGNERHRQLLSSPPVQPPQRQQQLEERGRHSSPIAAAAAATAAAVTYLTQDDNNIETMMSSQIVPQVNDTPSIMSETPHAVMAPTPLLPVSAPSGSVPRRALTPMKNITTTTTGNQVPNQTRSGSQAWSRSLSVTNNDIQSSPTSPQTRHHSNSPRIRIKSEELDEPFFKTHVLSGDGAAGPDGDSKAWRGPKYKDYDVSIVIPSSVGSSDVGMSGHPESSNAQERREQARKSERRLPDKWRSPTPMPGSMHAKREATTSRQQGIFWESTRPPLRFGPGVAKVAPVDLFGARSGYSQQRHQHRQHGPSSSRPALLSPRSSVPRPRPYPPPAISPTRRASQAQTHAPIGGGLPSIFFARRMSIRPPPPRPSSSSSSSQQQRGQGQGQSRSSPMMAPPANQSASAASASASTTAPAFTGPQPAAPTPRYFNPPPHSHPQGQPAWRLPEFMDENGHPHPPVVFYTHIDRVDNFYHQHYPASTASRSRDVSLSPRSARNSPNFFARRSEGERMEDVSGGEGHEDMAMERESHHHQRQGRSRTTSRQADRDERREEDRRERRPLAKSESPQL